jgi:CDP-glycerol:poly(glycerophosphate) glycerophosphotransferase
MTGMSEYVSGRVGDEVEPDDDPATEPNGPEATGTLDATAQPTPDVIDRPALSAADLVRFDPHWCLFWGRMVLGSQLDVWFPYLKRSRHRFVVMGTTGVRPADQDRLAALPNVLVLQSNEHALEWLGRCQRFEGYLYVSTAQENWVNINRQRRKSHIFIGHGESAKGGSGSRTASIYDATFVADYGVVRRYPRAIRRWVGSGALAIGAPVVEGVRKDPRPPPTKVRTILYAPTWESKLEGGDYTSLDTVAPLLLDLLPALTARGTEVIVRPHPWTGRRAPELKASVQALYDAGAVAEPSKIGAMERADVLIGDVSGMTAEFLLTGRPAIMPITVKLTRREKDPDWLSVEYPWVYRWDPSRVGLLDLLATIEATDPLRRRRAAEASRKFRHHRSLEDAVRTFDLALDVIRWRRTPVPLRYPFEARLLLSRLRRPGTRHPEARPADEIG